MNEEKELLEIKIAFLQEIETFIEDFKIFLNLLQKEKFSEKELFKIYNIANYIVGTSGTFDFTEVSKLSFAIEFYIEEYINANNKSEKAFLTIIEIMIKELVYSLEKLCKKDYAKESEKEVVKNIPVDNYKHTIVIATNDDYISHPLRDILKNNSYKILIAKNGNEVIRLFKNNNLDLILLDKDISEKKSLYILNYVQDINPDLPVIFIVENKESDSNIAKLFEKGAYNYIKKPFNIKELALKIENIFIQ